MPLLLLVLLLPVVLIALMPLILIQRYRVGTARRMARPWMATFNVALMALSAHAKSRRGTSRPPGRCSAH
jgi:hypothetical protein